MGHSSTTLGFHVRHCFGHFDVVAQACLGMLPWTGLALSVRFFGHLDLHNASSSHLLHTLRIPSQMLLLCTISLLLLQDSLRTSTMQSRYIILKLIFVPVFSFRRHEALAALGILSWQIRGTGGVHVEISVGNFGSKFYLPLLLKGGVMLVSRYSLCPLLSSSTFSFAGS